MYPGILAQTQPDKPAVIQPSTGEILSYRELNERSNRLAHLLFDRGLRPGDHVALFLENHLVYFETVWACLRSGLYFTPINRHLSASEAAYIVDNCDAKVLIASNNLEQSAALGELSPRCTVKLSVGGTAEGFENYAAAVADKPCDNIAEERLGTMMLYSSGTTGKPKGILKPLLDQSPENGSPSVQFLADMFAFDTATVYLSTAPLYHGAPIGYSNAAIQSGGTVIMMEKFNEELALQLIEQYRVTHSQWVPAMFIRLLKLPEEVRTRYDLSSMRCAFHAAAPCPVDVKGKMIEWWGPVIEEYYSSTEAAGMAYISSEEWLKHPGSVGRARGKPFHICDEDGNEQAAGKSGLIYGEVPTGPSFVYHKDPEKTRSAIHPKNPDWVTVGDIGYLDEEGYLYLTDRKSFMIISGGVNIYPQQIEDALALYPKLDDVAVIGVPNEDLGEEVKAVIQLAPGIEASEQLADEIKDFVREKLGKQLVPRSIDFVDELPRVPTGKLNKKELRDKYWANTKAS
jgi:long-chain acyl-CoA synthetase